MSLEGKAQQANQRSDEAFRLPQRQMEDRTPPSSSRGTSSCTSAVSVHVFGVTLVLVRAAIGDVKREEPCTNAPQHRYTSRTSSSMSTTATLSISGDGPKLKSVPVIPQIFDIAWAKSFSVGDFSKSFSRQGITNLISPSILRQ
jgi:hypothetical protein